MEIKTYWDFKLYFVENYEIVVYNQKILDLTASKISIVYAWWYFKKYRFEMFSYKNLLVLGSFVKQYIT